MAHVIQLALGAFMSSLGVKDHARSWEAHEHDQQSGENESIHNGKSQRLRKEGNARINKVLAIRPGLAKIIEKVCTSRYFESPETDLHKAENCCCSDYANTWSSKWVHWVSKSQSPHHRTTNYECEDMLELETGVSQAGLPITRIHTRVAAKSKLHWIPATLHYSEQMEHWKVCHGSVEAIPILDPVDVEEAYSHLASQYHSIQWHVRSHGRHNASYGQDQDSVEGKLVLHCQVSLTEAFQIVHRSESNNGHAAHIGTYPRSFLEVAIVEEMGQVNRY